MWHAPMHGYWMPGFGIGEMMLLVILFWAFLLAGIAFLVWFIVASVRPGRQAPPHALTETPLDILNRRYASGELTREQYQEIKRTLEEK